MPYCLNQKQLNEDDLKTHLVQFSNHSLKKLMMVVVMLVMERRNNMIVILMEIFLLLNLFHGFYPWTKIVT